MTGQAGIVCSTCGADNREPRATCRQCGHALPLTSIHTGFVLASRYEIQGPLGAGGMGVVYRAHDRLLNETVAIKVLRPEAAQAPEIAARFISEIKLARAVSHRNVARIHEYGEDQGIRYISMAFVDGVDLKRVVRDRGPLAPERAFEVAIQVSEGLHAIHEEGIVHRDLKSSNVMLDASGVVRLMDFGLAKLWSDTPQDMTATGQIVGTPEYMSPEQILGRDIDRASDVYSLGVVTYELFTGRTPFRAATPVATLMLHLNEPPPLDEPSAERLPASVIPLLRKALSKQPGERFATALEFARALEQARAAWSARSTAAGDSVPTVTIARTLTPAVTVAAGAPTVVVRPARRVVLGVAVALALAALGVWLGFDLARPAAGRGGAAASAVPSPVAPIPAAPSAAPPSPAPGTARESAAVGVATLGAAAPPRPAPASRSADRAARIPPEAGTPLSAGAPAVVPESGAPRPASPVEALLSDAGAALEAQRYDDAIALYDQVLKLDPRQQVARVARATALNAKSAARAVEAPAADRGRSFVAEKTSASGADAGPDRSYSQAFEEGSGLGVRSDTSPGGPPGRIEFEAKPERIRAGEHYTLHVFFVNPAKAPIEIGEMVVTNLVNGRKSSGPVAPSTRTVAPEQKALLLSLSDYLTDATETWSLEVRIRTSGGETYRNQLAWK